MNSHITTSAESSPINEFVDLYDDELLQPIVLEHELAGWKEIPVIENHEPLVALGVFSDNHDIFTSAVYFGEHSNSPYLDPKKKLNDTLITMFVREDVAKMIRVAQQSLPEGHYLAVFDSYRSLSVQAALYNHYYNSLKTDHDNWSDEELSAETQKYVSLPSRDETKPSPHNTGGSVDLAIFTLPKEVDARVKEIDLRIDELKAVAPKEFSAEDELTNPVLVELYKIEMEKLNLVRHHAELKDFGTPFDYGGHEAAIDYYEKLEAERPLTDGEIEARDNRRMLFNAMKLAGMEPYDDEWWHFNSPKSQMGAKTAGLDHAEYGGVELDEQNQAFEQMRKMHHQGTVRIHEADVLGRKIITGHNHLLDDLVELNRVATDGADPRLTHTGKADVIESPGEKVA